MILHFKPMLENKNLSRKKSILFSIRDEPRYNLKISKKFMLTFAKQNFL